MARVTYFAVVAAVPVPDWSLAIGGAASIQLLAQAGIIVGPSPGETFRDAEQLTRLFEAIEAEDGLSVEVDDLWVPASWLRSASEQALGDDWRRGFAPKDATRRPADDPPRGVVYRLAWPVFAAAFRYRYEAMPLRHLIDEDWLGGITLSTGETDVFREWAARQIEAARHLYPKVASMRLANASAESS
jgi:hypothetical protein